MRCTRCPLTAGHVPIPGPVFLPDEPAESRGKSVFARRHVGCSSPRIGCRRTRLQRRNWQMKTNGMATPKLSQRGTLRVAKALGGLSCLALTAIFGGHDARAGSGGAAAAPGADPEVVHFQLTP